MCIMIYMFLAVYIIDMFIVLLLQSSHNQEIDRYMYMYTKIT